MPEKASFTAPLPIARPSSREPFMTINVTSSGMDITITDNDIIGKEARSRTYLIRAEDDETFIVPDDLHHTTRNFLVGIGQRMMYLKRFGFDREP